MINQSLAYKAIEKLHSVNQTPKTLQDFLNDPDFKKKATTTFAFVKTDASLAAAKEAMAGKPGCQDVFVTETGAADEPVLGWLTNVVIAKFARV